MSDVLVIDGTRYEIPEEDDWELGELAEFSRLRDKWGDLGSTIAVVWIVKHREDPSFTIEQAEHVKVGQIDEEAVVDVPPLTQAAAPVNGSAAETLSSSPELSVIPDGSGRPLSAGITG